VSAAPDDFDASDEADAPPYPLWPVETLDLNRLTLAVRHAEATEAGSEPALMVHGLGGASHNWTDLMGLLRDRLDSRAPDLPGFGLSPPPDDGDYSIAGHARAVVRLIEEDNRGPVHLFGNSLGGAVSTYVAARRPDLVRSLVLVSPALPDLKPRPFSTQVALLGLPGVNGVAAGRLRRLTPEQRVQGVLDLCYGDPSAVAPDRFAEAVRETERRMKLAYAEDALMRSTKGILEAYLTRGPRNLWRLAAQVQAPTLLLYGARDRLVDARMAQRAARTFPNARVVLLPRAGHVAMMENPELTAHFVREHLARAGL